MNLFEIADQCLHYSTLNEKVMLSRHAAQLAKQSVLSFDRQSTVKSIDQVSFPGKPVLVAPKALPRRRLGTLNGRIALLHAVAHIECYAIYLAWDIIYRFDNQPQQFYLDWLSVAADEARHFAMIKQRLQDLGSDYGQLPAHQGLWDVAVDTADNLLARLALVPRYMEARGLDATPGMVERLTMHGDLESAALLQQIVDEEVAHVGFGSKWFDTICQQRGLDSEATYFNLLQRYLNGDVRGPFNHSLRKLAGFSDDEIKRLTKLSVC
ncbi:MAG: ferritin-like domain-containing protein [Gammaproteobacteria bacterium]|nr:ferritin-like domain-containing protein [Gammaproteobacteria bacterium]